MNNIWISGSVVFTMLAISAAELPGSPIRTTLPAHAAESDARLSDLIFNLPESPPVGYPGNLDDSGSRGDCIALNPALTALVPQYEVYNEQYTDILEGRYVLGQTLSTQPTFWFHLTEVSPEMAFTLRLDNKTSGESQSFDVELPDEPGLFSFTLPNNAPGLTASDPYYWMAIAQINCDETVTKSLTVDGWIAKVAPSPPLSAQLQNATPEEKVVLLAENGIWFDALHELINIYQPEQTAWETAWEAMMTPFDLDIDPIFP